MKVIMVAVRDQGVAAFANPWFAPTVPAAIRYFGDAVNRPDPHNQWLNHPSDFSLWKLGEVELEDGTVEPCKPQQLCVAKDVVRGGNHG